MISVPLQKAPIQVYVCVCVCVFDFVCVCEFLHGTPVLDDTLEGFPTACPGFVDAIAPSLVTSQMSLMRFSSRC